MATIKVFRSETQRVTPQTQALGLRAPDLGIVGRAVSQLGEVVGKIGEVRGDMAATAEASAALLGYQTDLGAATREARRQKPKDAEAYYLQKSTEAYRRHSGNLSKLAGSMFAKPAGQARLSSRSSFFKENDARLESVAIASGDQLAQSYMPILTNLGADDTSRLAAYEGAQWQYQDLFAKGYINAETNIENQRKYAENALESILRKHMMLGKDGDDWDPSGVMDRFLAGTLGDNVADQLATLIKPEDLTKITDDAMDQAISMETEVRKAAVQADKEAKKNNDRMFATIFSATATPEGRQKAMESYKELEKVNGFETLADRENAEKMLGYLGYSEFATDDVNPDAFRTSKQGSSRSALASLESLHSKRLLSHAAVNNLASRLTESAFKSWHAKVDAEHTEEFNQMRTAIDTAFDLIRHRDVTDDASFEKQQALFAYTTALRSLEEWERDNPQATSMQIRNKAIEVIAEGRKTLAEAAQLKWDERMAQPSYTEFSDAAVLAPILNNPRYKDGGTAEQRVDHYIANLSPDNITGLGAARTLKKDMLFFKRWGVDMNKGLPK